MNIEKTGSDHPQTKLRRKKNRRRLFWLCILVAAVAANYIAGKKLRDKGYSGTWDFISTVVSNYRKGMDAKPENLSIEIRDKDFKLLEKNRNTALERGVIVNDMDGDYVPAEMTFEGKKMKVKLRLKGHMTDHLQNDKWSFRIKIKDKKNSFMGMKRFSIQHPGTRGYIYEWIYHELMKKEGVIALRYKFINVTVNGRDWGIYAVEENFEKELVENNARPEGPLLRFNPDMYWLQRLDMMKREATVAEYSSYYSSNPEAYREDYVLEDSLQRQYYLKAIALMEGVRERKIPVDRAFDIDKLAKYHAVIDLVGGQNSIDWSDVKYYYNPVTQKLEPVAYESFTDFSGRAIAGTYKYVQPDSNENYEDWHTTLFSNRIFFKRYVETLERLSEPSYLDDFFSDANKELQSNLAILYREFPYKKFEKEGYYRNQKIIRKILDVPIAFHAYFKERTGNTLRFQLGPIGSLPVEVRSVTIGKAEAFPQEPLILPSKQQGDYVQYREYEFVLPEGTVWNDSLSSEMIMNYSIPGARLQKKQPVFSFPHTDDEFIAPGLVDPKGNVKEFSFLDIDEAKKTIQVRPGKQQLLKDLVVPAGYVLMAGPGVSMDLLKSARIISFSPFLFSGTEDQPVLITSGDHTGQGIELLNAGVSEFRCVDFRGHPAIKDTQWKRSGLITVYDCSAHFSGCTFSDCGTEDVLSFIRSEFSFDKCLFSQLKNDAVDADYSSGKIRGCVFESCAENALDAMMSRVSVEDVYIKGSVKGLNVKAGAELKGRKLKISNTGIAISAEDNSGLALEAVEITDCENGIAGYKNKPGGGYPDISISSLSMKNVSKEYLKEKKASMLINGKEITAETEDVELLIEKNAKK
jgi:hypothetical protein